MASPQVEDGFVRTARELQSALCKTRVPGEARQMFDVILMKTYGYHKKQDRISTSQFMQLTGMSRIAVYRARKKLVSMNMITVYNKADSYILYYSIQKNYEKWKVSTKMQISTKKSQGVYKNDTQVSTKMQTPLVVKDNTKENIQKKVISRASRETWLTIFGDYWEKQLGGKMAYGMAAKFLKPLVDEHGSERVMLKFKAYFSYVRVTGSQPFANISIFASRFEFWQAGCQYNKTKKGWEAEDY